MAEWKPIAEGHAIERVRIVLFLKSKIPTKTAAAVRESSNALLADTDFAHSQDRRANVLEIAVNTNEGSLNIPAPNSQLVGWQMVRKNQDDQVIESLVLENNQFMYESTEYSSWGDFLDNFSKVSADGYDKLLAVEEVASLVLEYVDRFIYDGPSTEAEPSKLIERLVDEMPDKVLSGELSWHLHRGWFDELGDKTVLVNQNLDAQDGLNQESAPTRTVQIYTKLEHREVEPMVDMSEVKHNLELMHKMAKRVFASVLVDDMKQKVGIKE